MYTSTDSIVSKYAQQLIRVYNAFASGEQEVLSMEVQQNIIGNPYKGWNATFLPILAEALGYRFPLWLTKNQAYNYCVDVREGEKPTTVYYNGYYVKSIDGGRLTKMTDDDYWALSKGERDARGLVLVPEQADWEVYNIAQTDFFKKYPKATEELEQMFYGDKERKSVACWELDRFVGSKRKWLCPIELVGYAGAKGQGFREGYDRDNDLIRIYPKECFNDERNYYRELIRFMAASSGSEERLDRGGVWSIIKGEIAHEEVVRELTTLSMCAALGIDYSISQDAATRVRDCISTTGEDARTFINKATNEATRATKYLLKSLGPGARKTIDLNAKIEELNENKAEREARAELKIKRLERTVKIKYNRY